MKSLLLFVLALVLFLVAIALFAGAVVGGPVYGIWTIICMIKGTLAVTFWGVTKIVLMWTLFPILAWFGCVLSFGASAAVFKEI